MTHSQLTPKAAGKVTAGRGHGIFATSRILKDEWIATWSGETVTEKELASLPPDRHSNSLQIGIDLYLVPSELTAADYVNHSCAPNAGLRGDRSLVAMRDIEPGEEICYDYAMTDTSAYDEFTCLCGSSKCRRQVTKDDWRSSELRECYRGYLSSYIEELMVIVSKADDKPQL